MARLRLTTVTLLAFLVAGCGAEITVGSGPNAAGGADAGAVDCGGTVYDPGELAHARGIEALPEGPASAVDDAGEPAFDPSEDWRVVHQSDDRVDLVRELDEPFDNGGGDVRTHESRTIERFSGSVNVPDGTWMLTSAGPCAQRLVTDDPDREADLTLAREPAPTDTVIELHVHERACASGQTAEGRVELAELTETAERIELRIRVRPLDGAQTCQGNPPTPFTVELTEPVGDREIVDASVVPPRTVDLSDDA